MKRLVFFGVLIILTSSCATEKLNLSPLSNNFYSETKGSDSDRGSKKSFNINVKENVNASEISNLISTFPKFKNNGLNDEITSMKYSLQNYLYAIDANNSSGKSRALKSFEKSYRKIQKSRQSLDKDDDEVINRYLVRLKTNVSVIEDALSGS
ncbi:hypothetical protein H3Z85_10435 [Chryseobacterium indologenes]|uniref:Uncharacterized protein n=1 Tax=Chryseobacterium indologenes TaxID=253 RepID=A0A1Z3W7P0_CHRID|nr:MULTISPECIES: hypothetical protein [Chryseobacterium]ASE63790.1 hypothetical protein CEQ15_21060 [Chryseobacterium indologenes]ATN07784.1 hypothetical protein CRN76_21510 [Chryseobacterium indologenes]AYY83479.1 hypothetical protein EGX91_02335 [Chryseobacterium indologenes]AYZ37290.1 hypothetical protein EGY07_17970 [Chryseobacterium indologenes]AZB19498.1 hypothetical protein EG352_17815 [Chryseobacterium indologenes]